MSSTANVGGFKPARQQQPLAFDPECAQETTSWQRADPVAASITRLGRYGFVVELPDGDPHVLAIGYPPDGDPEGWCRCKGFEHNDGPCAHLCTVRKADWHTRNLASDLLDDDGDTIKIAPYVESEQPPADEEPSPHTPDLSDLTDRQREVYLAVTDRGRKPHEVADDDGIAPTTARTHLYRARQQLAQQTGEVFEGGHDAR